jgi:hypothetical protein
MFVLRPHVEWCLSLVCKLFHVQLSQDLTEHDSEFAVYKEAYV